MNAEPATGSLAGPDQARLFLEALFPALEQDERVTTWTSDGRRSVHYLNAQSAAEQAAQPGANDVYVGVGTRRSGLDGGHRGGAADVRRVGALWIDVDIAGPGHAGPLVVDSMDDARKLVMAVPVPPSMVVLTGGGVHVYWLLTELLPASEFEALLRSWRRWWSFTSDRLGCPVDTAVFSVDRVMRLPGTHNGKLKVPRPATLQLYSPARRYPSSEFLEVLEISDTSPPAARPSSGSSEPRGSWMELEKSDITDVHPLTMSTWEVLRDRFGANSPIVRRRLGHPPHLEVVRPTVGADDDKAARGGVSGTVGLVGPDVFYCHTSAWPPFVAGSAYGLDDLNAMTPDMAPIASQEIRHLWYGAQPGLAGTDREQPALFIGAGGRELAPVLSEAALYGPAGAFVQLVAPHSEADPAALLVHLLVAVGNLIGGGPRYRVEAADHPARLFAVIVGASAKARKGTAWRQVKSMLQRVDPVWVATRTGGGLASGEGLVEAVADADVEPSHATPVDKRLLVVEEEFGRALTAAGREGSTLSHVVREAWDNDTLHIRTRKAVQASETHISIIGHITANELRRKLTEADRANGLANRFLFIHASRSQLLPDGGSPPEREFEQVAHTIKNNVMLARQRSTMRRSPAAVQRWQEIYCALALDDVVGQLGALVDRAEAQVLRLSLVYALLDGSPQIEVAHLDAALAVWEYSRATVTFVFGDGLGDEVADRLMRGIHAAGAGGLTVTEQSALFSRNVPARRLRPARDLLLETGRIVERRIQRDGAARVVHVAAPHLLNEKDEIDESRSI